MVSIMKNILIFLSVGVANYLLLVATFFFASSYALRDYQGEICGRLSSQKTLMCIIPSILFTFFIHYLLYRKGKPMGVMVFLYPSLFVLGFILIFSTSIGGCAQV
jgi:uncharacterized PurR-regulated membrane protein YhhQ (DUF165 family)